jgi:hypothetical protein
VTFPDDNPGDTTVLTLRDVREILESSDALYPADVDQALAHLRDGAEIAVCDCVLFLPLGNGLYEVYVKAEEEL